MRLKTLIVLAALAVTAYGQTAQTRSTLEGTYFADGQAAGSITPSRIRDFVRSIVPETKTEGTILQFGASNAPGITSGTGIGIFTSGVLSFHAGLVFNSGTGVLSATGFSGPLTGNVTGNASGTAAALAANAANCSAGSYPLGIDASGAVEDCTAAAVGNMVNTGTPAATAIPKYSSTAGTAIAPSGVTIDASDNLAVPGTITSGDGTVAGLLTLKELAANGTNIRAFSVPDALTASLTFALPNAVPTAGQMMVFGAPAADVSAVTFATPLVVVGTGTADLGTAEIASEACATVVTVSATGVATTDVITWTPNADITAVTGYAPVTEGGLSIYPYPSADNVNFKVCNPTAAAITPGAVTLNFKVVR